MKLPGCVPDTLIIWYMRSLALTCFLILVFVVCAEVEQMRPMSFRPGVGGRYYFKDEEGKRSWCEETVAERKYGLGCGAECTGRNKELKEDSLLKYSGQSKRFSLPYKMSVPCYHEKIHISSPL